MSKQADVQKETSVAIHFFGAFTCVDETQRLSRNKSQFVTTNTRKEKSLQHKFVSILNCLYLCLRTKPSTKHDRSRQFGVCAVQL